LRWSGGVDLAQPREHRDVPGQAVQHRTRVFTLRAEPGLDFRSLEVLQPAVRIGDGGAVQRVDHGSQRCRRWLLPGKRGKRASEDHEKECATQHVPPPVGIPCARREGGARAAGCHWRSYLTGPRYWSNQSSDCRIKTGRGHVVAALGNDMPLLLG
jgi:hypothetical protein